MRVKLYDTLNGVYVTGQEYESVSDFFASNPVEDFSEAELENLTLENKEKEYSKSLDDAFEDSFMSGGSKTQR